MALPMPEAQKGHGACTQTMPEESLSEPGKEGACASSGPAGGLAMPWFLPLSPQHHLAPLQ